MTSLISGLSSVKLCRILSHKHSFRCFLALGLVCVLSVAASCSGVSRAEVIARFLKNRPVKWGMEPDGVLTHFAAGEKIAAITLDACDGRAGGYDGKLIDFLKEHKIPATLFMSGKWIAANEKIFLALASNPLFEIANHGSKHKPLSVAGKMAYKIQGTRDAGEVFDEVEDNARVIENLTGRKPFFFRSGTAHYDDVAVQIVNFLGYKIAGFSINGDGGGRFSPAAVKNALLSAQSGDIILLHMNRPGSGALAGLEQSVPLLRQRGFRFVRLSEEF